jgi:hypothetical protein
MRHVTVSSRVLMCEMERQQSRRMTVIAWFYEVFPVWFQCAGIPPPRPGPGRPYPGERNPHTGFFFRLTPYAGPWEVSPRGGKKPPPLSSLGSTCQRNCKGREEEYTPKGVGDRTSLSRDEHPPLMLGSLSTSPPNLFKVRIRRLSPPPLGPCAAPLPQAQAGGGRGSPWSPPRPGPGSDRDPGRPAVRSSQR